MAITRRTMLGQSGLFALSLAAVPARAAVEKCDVVVIGAGLAGLNAATILTDLGAKVMVLEAQDKPGGRLHTLRTADGYFDCGATTIGPEYGRVRGLAERFGVALVPPHRRGGMAWAINGASGAGGDWAQSPANRTVGDERAIAIAQLEVAMINRFGKLPAPDAWRDPAYARWDIPLDRFYRECGLSEEAIRLIGITSNCETLETTSALFQMKELQSIASWGKQGGGQKNSVYEAGTGDFHYIAGGSDTLPEAVAQGLGAPVRCGVPVTAIDMTGTGCEVTCADGSRIACAYVVSAVPLTALSRIAISPHPTGLRAESIDDALYMGTSHFFFAVTAPYWERDGLEPGLITDGAIERVFANKGESGAVEWLDVWINGAGTLPFDALSPDKAAELAMAELVRVRPAMAGAIRPLGQHSWRRNPFVGGNKHIFRPGQVSRFGAAIAEPWHRLHFAGEHTRDVEPGMDAAAATGERAALEVAERLGKA
ncbi:flavin monoamine oxidase family protein [Novosphingobium kaempferiae]|uniref:flavin monoamine oxidase family protein n=1 Tax=Novosphingobium kaempferiae TaxID=2896849 RepID=UPI001E606F16|nr:NAD(P)/FAD-dependent oxidoreductase [Novosphingobium kaempferiae]